MAIERIPASDSITQICKELDYSRAHVAKVLRMNARRLNARMVGGRWMIPQSKVEVLRRLVRDESGPRYRLGERGPNLSW